MPVYLQLYDVLLKCLSTVKDVDATFAVLSSLKYLVLHGECLNYTISQYHDFIVFTLKKQLIPNLWKLLQAEHSHLACVCVPLLLHAITLPSGADLLWHLMEDDFGSEDWKPRFNAVEKVTVLARCLEADSIRYNQVIQTSLAHAFCHLITSVEDITPAVAQKTIMYLETIKPSALKCLCQSLEFQFDTVINDRGMILQRMHLLAAVLPGQPILTWEFFLNRFDTLSLEAQLDLENSGDIAFPQDLTCSDRHSDFFLKKLNRARFALARTDSVRSVSSSLKSKPPYRRAVSVPLHLITKGISPPKVEKEKSCIRQQSAPQFTLGRRMTSSKFNLGNFGNVMFPGGQLREFTDEESNFAALLQRAMDLEGVDRDTVYQLVALLMKFMVKCGQVELQDKAQSIVLRHLNILLGYNQTEKTFSVPPYKLRSSAVFNAFLSNIPYVLDRNFKLGNTILPITLLLLQYSPSPQRYASDYQPPNYTLWYLEPHTRQAWLMALLVILYKYQISSSPVSAIIQTLVRLVINTVDAQHHRCKKSEDGFPPPSPTVHRGKDMGKMSVSDLENIQETETPPQSPSASQASQEDKDVGVGIETVQVQPHVGVVQYLRRQPDGADSSEGVLSDAECTPTLPGGRKNGVRKVAKARQPRPLVDYSEQESTEDEGRESDHARVTPLTPKVIESKPALMGYPVQLEPQPEGEQEVSQPASPGTSSTVEKKMAQQLQEFTASHVEGGAVKPFRNSLELKEAELAAFDGQGSGVSEVKASSSSSATEASSVARDGATASEHSREAASELDSTEESEKTQTSDAESEKLPGATDSGGDATHEDSKDDLPVKSKSQAVFKANFRKRKDRKTGLTTVELQKKCPDLNEMGPGQEDAQPSKGPRRARRAELLAKSGPSGGKKTTSSRYGDNVVVERCAECQAVLEQYDDDTIGLCITVLATFIHRESSLATPLLLDMLQCVSRIASSSQYSWQAESSVMIPGNCVSIARQFLRCVLHQLAPNGIFPMLFQSNFDDPHFWKTMAAALVDFNDLTTHSSLVFLLEGLNEMKNFPQDNILLVLSNMSTYLNCVTLESSTPMWTNILGQFELFFRRLPAVLPSPCELTPVLKIMISILKIPATSSYRSILEPFSKVLSFAIQNGSFKLQQLLDLCSLGNRAFVKDRDKLYLTRTVVFELVQALKFKSTIPDENLLMLIQFVVLDAGGTICPSTTVDSVGLLVGVQAQTLISTSAADCMRQNLNDCMEFIADLHTLTKVKSNMRGGGASLNEDTLGSQIKSGIAQFLALEISRGNGRDNRAITRYLPWLYHPPSAMQQGPKEFIDCIGHIRLLSWLLIGSLTHTAVMEGSAQVSCLPLPLEASAHIADHIMVIMSGFAEQSKASVLHMSSLFHAFILCQLWTMYCESAAAMHPQNSEQHQRASAMVMDFWARVTPGILQLLSHSKVLAEMVNLHFLSLMEALQECNSCILANLYPMWTSILFAYHTRLPGHLHVRLQNCQNWEPPHPTRDQASFNSSILLTWLKRSQFKLGQIEVQSSAATQFYTV